MEDYNLQEYGIHDDHFGYRKHGQAMSAKTLTFMCNACGHEHEVTPDYVKENFPLNREVVPRCRRCGEKWISRFIFRERP